MAKVMGVAVVAFLGADCGLAARPALAVWTCEDLEQSFDGLEKDERAIFDTSSFTEYLIDSSRQTGYRNKAQTRVVISI
jgi:hypothetical protein